MEASRTALGGSTDGLWRVNRRRWTGTRALLEQGHPKSPKQKKKTNSRLCSGRHGGAARTWDRADRPPEVVGGMLCTSGTNTKAVSSSGQTASWRFGRGVWGGLAQGLGGWLGEWGGGGGWGGSVKMERNLMDTSGVTHAFTFCGLRLTVDGQWYTRRHVSRMLCTASQFSVVLTGLVGRHSAVGLASSSNVRRSAPPPPP